MTHQQDQQELGNAALRYLDHKSRKVEPHLSPDLVWTLGETNGCYNQLSQRQHQQTGSEYIQVTA